MFVCLALYTALYVLLELIVHLTFSGRSDASFALFVLLHQLTELLVAVGIGYTFRAQPFNVHFHQIQQAAPSPLTALRLARPLPPDLLSANPSPNPRAQS